MSAYAVTDPKNVSSQRQSVDLREDDLPSTSSATVWKRPPLPLRILLCMSCSGPASRIGKLGWPCCRGDDQRALKCRYVWTIGRIINSIFFSHNVIVEHGQLHLLKSWFALSGFMVYIFIAPSSTIYLQQFFEMDGGIIGDHDAARLSSFYGSSRLFRYITLPSWLIFVVCVFFAVVSSPYYMAPLGEFSGSYNRVDMLKEEVEVRTNMSAVWTSPTSFVVPGLNSSQFKSVYEEADRELVVPAGIHVYWVLFKISMIVEMVTVFWPMFTGFVVFTWHSLLQTLQQQETKMACVKLILSQKLELGSDQSAIESRMQLLNDLNKFIEVDAVSMKRLNSHLAKVGSFYIILGPIVVIFYLLDFWLPVPGATQFPLHVALPIVFTCALVLFGTLGIAASPSIAWHAFMHAFKSPEIVGRLNWCQLGIILEGWSGRQADFSWVFFGTPVTPMLYNRAFFGMCSLLSIVVAVMLRNF